MQYELLKDIIASFKTQIEDVSIDNETRSKKSFENENRSAGNEIDLNEVSMNDIGWCTYCALWILQKCDCCWRTREADEDVQRYYKTKQLSIERQATEKIQIIKEMEIVDDTKTVTGTSSVTVSTISSLASIDGVSQSAEEKQGMIIAMKTRDVMLKKKRKSKKKNRVPTLADPYSLVSNAKSPFFQPSMDSSILQNIPRGFVCLCSINA